MWILLSLKFLTCLSPLFAYCLGICPDGECFSYYTHIILGIWSDRERPNFYTLFTYCLGICLDGERDGYYMHTVLGI